MTTRSSSAPPLPPLFQGPYYRLQENMRRFEKAVQNRRRLSQWASSPATQTQQIKPKISKLPGTRTWACRLLPQQEGWVPVFGFGTTPAFAYKDWKHKVSQWL